MNKYGRLNFPAFLLTLLICWLPSPEAPAHGGVVLEDDLCLIKVGFYQAHFTVYQPRSRDHQQFCEDLPDTGETVFVLEYLHDGLESLPIDFRIVRNTTGLGRFAGWQDVRELKNLDEITVFYQPPALKPDVLTVLHTFHAPGEYIGMVTALSPEKQTLYAAAFPFEVGFFGLNYPLIAFACVGLTPLLYWLFISRRRRVMPAAMLCVVMSGVADTEAQTPPATPQDTPWVSAAKHFTVRVIPSMIPVPINRMHDWRIELTDSAGDKVLGAEISVSGGMPDHDHGLPSNPRMTIDFNNGEYLVEGMKFHMHGPWQVELNISNNAVVDTVELEFYIQ